MCHQSIFSTGLYSNIYLIMWSIPATIENRDVLLEQIDLIQFINAMRNYCYYLIYGIVYKPPKYVCIIVTL